MLTSEEKERERFHFFGDSLRDPRRREALLVRPDRRRRRRLRRMIRARTCSLPETVVFRSGVIPKSFSQKVVTWLLDSVNAGRRVSSPVLEQEGVKKRYNTKQKKKKLSKEY